MKKNTLLPLVILLLITSLMSCNGQQSENGSYTSIEASEFKDKVEASDVQLVDVRTISEYQSGHLHGAVLADYLGGQFTEYKTKLDKSKPVYVYCAVGGRSKRAALELEKEGFEVIELAGGITDWKAKGFDVEN
ncbi:rhodanese-like domain-containing protein [Flammeovirgaceae bacterium KN852]|uniref:Rhodanese-like domain-containing protein n=2 Tax=Marinigracilibium pacificum TaxID=2729599 RepID=A0A848J3X1_9BACT|nr:rhodanese-like domain-containing protein [Marinigracilibium pacificum]